MPEAPFGHENIFDRELFEQVGEHEYPRADDVGAIGVDARYFFAVI